MRVNLEELERRRGDTSTEKFANELGITNSHYRSILKGEYKPGLKFIEKVISKYEDAIDTIIFLKEDN